MVQMAGAGVLGLGALQGAESPRKRFYKDPTGTSPTLGVIRSGHLLFVSGVGGWYPSRRPKARRHPRADGRCARFDDGAARGSGRVDGGSTPGAGRAGRFGRTWEPMNEVYNTKVPEPRPVRSYFGCTGFATPGQLVQIDAIAYVD